MTDQDPTQVNLPKPAAPDGSPALPPAPSVSTDGAASDPPEAIPTQPVAAVRAARPGRSRARWLVAAAATLLVVATAAGATLLMTGDSGDPTVVAYTPADSIAYTELRLDLPGDQAAELAKVMKAFPGFEDQAAFPVKLTELLDQLAGKASDGKVSWKTDIDPWFGGQIAVSVGPLPAEPSSKDGRAVALLTVKDATAARAWLDKLVADTGATSSTTTYNGVEIVTVKPASSESMGDVEAGYAVVGPVLAIGDAISIRAVIDTSGRTGLASDPTFKEASATVTGDRLAFFYADLETITQSAKTLAAGSGEVPDMPAFLQDWTAPWVAGSVRAQDGAFVVESRSPHVDTLGPRTSSASTLPAVVPATTVLLAEGHDVGATLAEVKALLAEQPDLADAVKQIDDALDIVGGFDAATGWIGEAGVAITRDGTDVAGGLVVAPTDAADAERLMNQLKAFVQLGGAQAGISVTDEVYGDATITIVDLSGLGGLVDSMSEGAVSAPADIKLAYAVTDQVVVIGYGTDFVKAVLDARTGESLAGTDRFKTALAQAGAEHATLLWLDVTGVRGAVEDLAPAEMFGQGYDSDVKPYLEAIDSVVAVSSPGDTIDRGTVIIRVTGD